MKLVLAKAEKRGDRPFRKTDPGRNVSDESKIGGTDSDSEGPSYRGPLASSTEAGEEKQWILRELEESIARCLVDIDESAPPEGRRALRNQLEELRSVEKDLRKKKSENSATPRYSLHSRKEGKGSGKMCPVIVCGQNLEYKPL